MILNNEAYIYTFSGYQIDVLNPNPKHIFIEDIAHVLSLMPRFGGHTRKFYSVASHSIWVAKHLKEHKLEGLLHDATEAYLVDIPRPIKPHLTNYKKIEDNLMNVIFNKFGLEFPLSSSLFTITDTLINERINYNSRFFFAHNGG